MADPVDCELKTKGSIAIRLVVVAWKHEVVRQECIAECNSLEEHDGEDLDALFRDDRLSMRGSGDAFAGFGRPESEFSRRPPGR